ncbi:Blp family class II bacteriocin [Gemella sp. 19428wG2_WT2a]|nr:Blp family class II bacteriocin [Gemella sp. 19428wG2_WT2a]TFU57541.1 hypothetical protein E4T67_06710 [Gemella sp. WT2a]
MSVLLVKELTFEELLVVDGGTNWAGLASCTLGATVGGAAAGFAFAGVGAGAGALLGFNYGLGACMLAGN